MSGKTSVKSKKFRKTNGRNTVPLIHQLLSLLYPIKTYRGLEACREAVPSREFNPNQDLQLMNTSAFFPQITHCIPYLTLFPIGDCCDKNPSLGYKVDHYYSYKSINEVITVITPINGLISMVTGVIAYNNL